MLIPSRKAAVRGAAVLLALMTAAFAPGLAPYQAAAQVLSGSAASGKAASGIPVLPRAGSGAGSSALAPISGLSMSLGPAAATPLLRAPGLAVPQGLAPSAVSAAAPAASVAAAPFSAAPALGASGLVAPIDAPRDGRASGSARLQLAGAAEGLAQARSDSDRGWSLEGLFSGARRLAAGLFPAARSAPEGAASALAATAAPAQAAVPSASHGAASLQPPAPIALEGRGLRPGERFLSPPSPAPSESGLPEDVQKRAIWGLTWNRFFSLLAGSISGIAYPLVVIAAVGQAGFYDLCGLGSLVNIPLALLAGKVGDMMPLKKYTVFNVGLRSVISVIQAVFILNGWLSFWPLLFLTVLSAWQFSTLFSNDFAMQTEIVGKDPAKIRATEALIRMTTIGVTVLAGLFLGAAAVHSLGFFWTFMLVAGIQLIPVFILQRMLPKLGEGRPGLAGLWRSLVAALKGVWRRGLPRGEARSGAWGKAAWVAALGAAVLIFFVPIPGASFLLRSPIPFVIVSGLMIWRSRTSRIIRSDRLLKTSLLFVMIGAFIEVPLRNSVLGALATETMKDAVSAAAYLGSLVAAFYLGQLPSGTGMLDPKLTVKVGSRAIPLRPVTKWLGALGVAAWTYFVLLPQGALASAAAAVAGWLGAPAALAAAGLTAALAVGVVAGYFALHHLTPKISDVLWMRLEAGALLFMSLPLLFWGQPWALYLALAAFGFVLNGSQRMVSATFSAQAKKLAKDQFQTVTGMRGAFFNISTSLAFTTYSLAKTIPAYWGQTHAFPFTWYVIGATYALFAILFWRGSTVFQDAAKGRKG